MTKATSVFDAYGDESAGLKFVAYGTLLLPVASREDLEAKIAELKISYGASSSDDLHCRVLFSGDARKKSVWSALEASEVFDLYSKLIALAKPSLTRTIVVIANKAELPDAISEGQWEASNPQFIGPMGLASGWPFRDKQIAAACAQGTMIPISKWPGLKTVTFWPDPDSTLVEFAGGRRRFNQMLGAFIDNGAGIEPEKIEVSFQAKGKPVLLQVADLVAYVAQRAAGAKFSPLDLKFKALDKLIGAEKLRLGITPQGGIGFDIPNAVLHRKS